MLSHSAPSKFVVLCKFNQAVRSDNIWCWCRGFCIYETNLKRWLKCAQHYGMVSKVSFQSVQTYIWFKKIHIYLYVRLQCFSLSSTISPLSSTETYNDSILSTRPNIKIIFVFSLLYRDKILRALRYHLSITIYKMIFSTSYSTYIPIRNYHNISGFLLHHRQTYLHQSRATFSSSLLQR